jgi:hypothetical protein
LVVTSSGIFILKFARDPVTTFLECAMQVTRAKIPQRILNSVLVIISVLVSSFITLVLFIRTLNKVFIIV